LRGDLERVVCAERRDLDATLEAHRPSALIGHRDAVALDRVELLEILEAVVELSACCRVVAADEPEQRAIDGVRRDFGCCETGLTATLAASDEPDHRRVVVDCLLLDGGR